MKELMELLTRFVVAFEKFTDQKDEQKCKCDEKPETKLETKSEIKDIPRDYEAIAAQKDGRETLLNLCKKKGIKVKKGTRDATLIKLLRETNKKDVDKDNSISESDIEDDQIISEVDTSAGQTTVTLPKPDKESIGNLEKALTDSGVQVELPEIEEKTEVPEPEKNDDDIFSSEDGWDDVWED